MWMEELDSNLLLFLLFCCLSAAFVSFYVFWINAKQLVQKWDKCSGLHHWTELPKGEGIQVVARSSVYGKTVLGVDRVEMSGESRFDHQWFVQFDVLLRPEINHECMAVIVILDDEKQFLHWHKQAGVIPIFVRDLKPCVPAPDSKGGEAVSVHQPA